MGSRLSGGGSGRFTVESNAEINVTPFVDVMLVMLIVFMASIPLATTSLKLDMPPFHDGRVQDEPVYVSIEDSGELWIVNQKSSLAALPGDLSTAFGPGAIRADQPVLIRADSDVPYERFVEVLDRLQDNGFTQVSLISEDIA